MSCNNEIWHSYTLLKEDPKIIWTRETRFEFCRYQGFFTGNQQILQNLFYIFYLTYFAYLKINMVTILMMPAKMATLGLFKIKVF